ncbi:MAG TPA: hypothetical protein VF718_15155 [Allosphingosinicella sp.]|jgi:hypothetical protein
MPRFFFKVRDDVVVDDEEGMVLPDVEAARLQGIRSARALACEQVLHGRLNVGHSIEIQDEEGRQIATIRFGDAVRIED